MDTFSLTNRQADLHEQFSALQDKKQALIEQIKQVDEEALKISGQYALLEELVNEARDGEPKDGAPKLVEAKKEKK